MLHISGAFETEVKAFVDSLVQTDVYELDQYWVLLYQRFFEGVGINPYAGENCFDILKAEDVSLVPKKDHQSKNELAMIAEAFAGVELKIKEGKV